MDSPDLWEKPIFIKTAQIRHNPLTKRELICYLGPNDMLHALECRLGPNNVSLAEHTKRKHNVQVPVQFTVEVVVVRKYIN